MRILKREFKEYLEKYLDDKKWRAVRGSGVYCPIGRFLKDKSSDKYFITSSREDTFLYKGNSVEKPKWVNKFIKKVDFDKDGCPVDTPIDAKESLEILESI